MTREGYRDQVKSEDFIEFWTKVSTDTEMEDIAGTEVMAYKYLSDDQISFIVVGYDVWMTDGAHYDELCILVDATRKGDKLIAHKMVKANKLCQTKQT